jgi:hypothetical protein
MDETVMVRSLECNCDVMSLERSDVMLSNGKMEETWRGKVKQTELE